MAAPVRWSHASTSCSDVTAVVMVTLTLMTSRGVVTWSDDDVSDSYRRHNSASLRHQHDDPSSGLTPEPDQVSCLLQSRSFISIYRLDRVSFSGVAIG